MKYFLPVILVLSILSFQFSELLVYTAFKLNQDYIAKNLCVEKDIEDSTCKGCCQLKKKVNQQQEQKKELPPVQQDKQNITFCRQSLSANVPAIMEMCLFSFAYLNNYQFQIQQAIFHPPELRSKSLTVL